MGKKQLNDFCLLLLQAWQELEKRGILEKQPVKRKLDSGPLLVRRDPLDDFMTEAQHFSRQEPLGLNWPKSQH